MKQVIFTIIILVLFPLLSSGFQGREMREYFATNFTADNGLPQNSIRKIAVDYLGFVWLATEGGLVRYDGSNFKVYNRAALDLDSDRIPTFKRNPAKDDFYAIAEGGKLIKIDGGNASEETSYSTVRSLDRTTLLPIQKQTGDQFVIPDMIPAKKVNYQIIQGKGTNYYMYRNEKILFCRADSVRQTLRFPGKMSFDVPPLRWNEERSSAFFGKALNVYNFMDIDGSLFYHIGGHGSYLLYLNPSSEQGISKIRLTGEIESNPAFINRSANVSIIHNQFNNQTFAFLNDHLYQISFRNNLLDTRLLMKGIDLNEDHVSAVYYQEKDEIIFLGSITKGLFVYTPKYFKTFLIGDDTEDNVFYAHLPYSLNSIITPQGYTADLTKPGAGAEKIAKDESLRSKFLILRDRKQFLWLAKIGPRNFVEKFSPDGKRLIKSWFISDEPVKFYQGNTREGIWIGSRSGTLFYLEQSPGKSDSIVVKAKIPDKEITWLLQNDPEHVLIGTVSGLYRYSLKSDKISQVREFRRLNIRTIYASDTNRLWVTTYGSGFYLIEKGKIHKMPSDQNRFLDYAHCILEDSLGNFWFTTNQGLFQARKQDLIDYRRGEAGNFLYLYYDKRNGFQTNEFNGACQPCGVKLANGRLSFPSLRGLVNFSPAKVHSPTLDAPFIIQNVNLDGNKLTFGDTLNLPFDFKHLTFSIATPYFGHKNNLRFLYQVKKSDGQQKAEWQNVSADREISLYNMPSGSYVLTIRKISNFGKKYVEKNLIINVAVAWYLRPWFIILATLGFVCTILFFVRWRTYYLIKQNQLLSQKVTRRTKELTNALEDLKVSDDKLQDQLKRQTQIIGVISHDLRTPLKHITLNSKKLHDHLEANYPSFPQLFLSKSIYESSDKIFALSDELLNFIKMTMKSRGEIKYEPVDIASILKEKRDLFADIAAAGETRIVLDIEENLPVFTNRNMLEIIIHNLLDNAVKSSWHDSIVLGCHQDNGTTVISINDTALGMPADIAGWLSDAENRDEGIVDDLPKNMGLGLIIVKEMTYMLKIRIKAESGPTGTQIQLLVDKPI
ncbi:sensor histidine kinase [Dyadobacter aurulentus]|uniref:sensor histidine kinase n=1 Tax=Dyadobacter sp. UC 10 TaxID=2605428 RepID=UPI0011F0E662|nr:ATP-binding protein [Dyadobacter sp. UC 10]KAA0992047.1 hypothetical protein FXO21_18645 [Dyadobacter sp. UC 10]